MKAGTMVETLMAVSSPLSDAMPMPRRGTANRSRQAGSRLEVAAPSPVSEGHACDARERDSPAREQAVLINGNSAGRVAVQPSQRSRLQTRRAHGTKR